MWVAAAASSADGIGVLDLGLAELRASLLVGRSIAVEIRPMPADTRVGCKVESRAEIATDGVIIPRLLCWAGCVGQATSAKGGER